MNLVGKWKVKEVMGFSLEEGMIWKPLEQVALEDPDSYKVFENTITEFCEDGTVQTLLPVDSGVYTKEQIDEAVEEGKVIRDGMLVLDTQYWKNEDGINYFNTEIQGEVFGEEVSPWAAIKEVEGMIEINAVRYARAE